LSSGKLLQDVLDANKEQLIGRSVLSKYGSNLPFLPKILSIAKALPLQIHPNKVLAAQLHAENSDKFSDDNYKPEIAVALNTFELFAGFKPFDAVEPLMQLAPLKRFLPEGVDVHIESEIVKQICRAMLIADESTVRGVQDSLSKIPRETLGAQSYMLDLLPRLQDQYSKSDNGILVALTCMNFITLQPGHAVYIPAGGIHAYLSGDIVECMARSNNVLNTGFCPRVERDSVDLFTAALTFEHSSVETLLLPRVQSEKSKESKTTAFKPPAGEFDLLVTELEKGETETVTEVRGPSTMIVTRGSGQMTGGGKVYDLQEGYLFFIGHGVEVQYTATTRMDVYRACAE